MKRTKESRSARGRLTGWTLRIFHHAPIPAFVWAVLLSCMPAPAAAMQILDAVDHAELEAEISDRAVSRIALAGDRIARIIRGPAGFAVEHDAARGDVYLRPADVSSVFPGGVAAREPLTLFVGTAAGFTYRLTLTVAERGSAQILIRNAAAASKANLARPADGRVGALVTLVRAVVRREPLPRYAIEAASGKLDEHALAVVETWRGPRFTARVLETEAGSGSDAEVLANGLVPDTAAVWVGLPGSGPSGGRLVVAVADRFGSDSAGRKP